mgnify:FL=1
MGSASEVIVVAISCSAISVNYCLVLGVSSCCVIELLEVLKMSPPLLPLLAVLEFINEELGTLSFSGDLKEFSLVTLSTLPLDFLLSSLFLVRSLASSSSNFFL